MLYTKKIQLCPSKNMLETIIDKHNEISNLKNRKQILFSSDNTKKSFFRRFVGMGTEWGLMYRGNPFYFKIVFIWLFSFESFSLFLTRCLFDLWKHIFSPPFSFFNQTTKFRYFRYKGKFIYYYFFCNISSLVWGCAVTKNYRTVFCYIGYHFQM